MKKAFILAFIIYHLSSIIADAQQVNLDSLFSVWQDKTQPDSSRTNAYDKYIWNGFLFSNPDSAIVLAQELMTFGEQHDYPGGKLKAYLLLGHSHTILSKGSRAIFYYKQSLKVCEEIGDIRMSSRALGGIGIVFKMQSNYTMALDYYLKGLKIDEDYGNKEGIAAANSNIGYIYIELGNFTKAMEYFQRCLTISEELGNKKLIAKDLRSIGYTYLEQNDYPKALEYLTSSLKLNREIGDKLPIADNLATQAGVYDEQEDYSKAIDLNQEAIKIYEEIGYDIQKLYPLANLGLICIKQGENVKALAYCEKAFNLSHKLGALEEEKYACKCLYDAYKAMGKGNEALVYLEKLNVINDSLNTNETNQKLQQMEFAKQMLQDSIAQAETERLVLEAHQEEVRQGEKNRNIALGAGGFLLLLAGGLYTRVRFIRKSKAVLQVEKDRSENLLLNILPEEIAQELKIYGKAKARDFDLVSILFTDFKGFTEASAKMSAGDLVSEINLCFEAFDGIMEKFSIEKIKTIGDAYMAAGGLPVPTDASVKNTVLAALEMQAFISKRKAENDMADKPAFEMRVGIHTGPVVAGIVGVKKFQYDIWGDTVNTAARMESSGEIGKVNISQATYELLKDDADFAFESRGKIEAKGKGEIEMYFVSKT